MAALHGVEQRRLDRLPTVRLEAMAPPLREVDAAPGSPGELPQSVAGQQLLGHRHRVVMRDQTSRGDPGTCPTRFDEISLLVQR